MRRLAVIVSIGLVAAACSSATTAVGGDVVDESGAYAAAIQYVLVQSDLRRKDLVYVAGPSQQLWESWCSFDTGAPGVERENHPACDGLDASGIDPPARYEQGGADAAEIEAALSHAEVEFIEDRDSVIEPFEAGMMIAPVQNGAGLIMFGVPVEFDDRLYLPVDTHGSGFLLELTPPDTPGGTDWKVTSLAQYAV